MIQKLHSFQSQVYVSYIQLFPTHMLSLESVLEFCHGIAKGGDYKVEFNQLSYQFYSVPNLLIFQQLVTMYLGGILVWVVNEIVRLNLINYLIGFIPCQICLYFSIQ